MANKKHTPRPQKLKKPFITAQKMSEAGHVVYSQHAIQRMIERGVDRSDVLHVIKTGTHIPKRDRYENGWSYCFEGRDLDNERNLRIAIVIKNNVYVVTVIDITRGEDGFN